MGLWEFLRQWRPSRVTVGIVASILLHLAIVALVLWGGKLVPRSRWNVKKGDSLIVELPKPEEPAPAGSAVGASPRPPSRPSPPSPPPASAPKPPATLRVARPGAQRSGEWRALPRPARADTAEGRRAGADPPEGDGAWARTCGARTQAAEPAARPADPTPPDGPERTGGTAAPVGPATGGQRAAKRQPSAPPAPDMRTALRRGAGGTGLQGRGGIEGEAIPLDSEDPNYNDYLDQVRRRIKEKWGYPCVGTPRNCEYKTASLDVHFGILKDGRVQFVDVVRSSPVRDLRRVRGDRHQAGLTVPARAGRHDEGDGPRQHGHPHQRPLHVRRASRRSPTFSADPRNR